MQETFFEENKKAPQETTIALSKSHLLFQLSGSFLWIVVCLYILFRSDNNIPISIIFSGILLYVTYVCVKKIKEFKNEPYLQLKLTQQGVYFKNKNFIPWAHINKFEICAKPNSNSKLMADDFLMLYTKAGKREIYVNQLSISSQKLNYLLKIYKNRSLNNIS